MYPRHEDNGIPRVYKDDGRRGEHHSHVALAGGYGLPSPDGCLFLDVLHIGESLAMQELFGQEHGGRTDATDPEDGPDLCRLKRRLGGVNIRWQSQNSSSTRE